MPTPLLTDNANNIVFRYKIVSDKIFSLRFVSFDESSSNLVQQSLSNRVKEKIEERKRNLRIIAEEDGEVLPLDSSGQLMDLFFSEFPVSAFPEITLTEDGCYYARLKKDENKLVIRFLEDNIVHYLLENASGFAENVSSYDFFKTIYSHFIKESFCHGRSSEERALYTVCEKNTYFDDGRRNTHDLIF